MIDIHHLSASSIAQAIREGTLSSVSVMQAHLQRINERNPALNAIVTLDDRALSLAQEADRLAASGRFLGPLHGVPFTVKDAFETAGVRTTSGDLSLSQYIPVRDADVVARLRAAGGILIGKTNLPPFAKGAQTDNALFGRTNNPWNLDYTPGGSSGGGAVAVAAGLSPLDIGSDMSGSLRLPAHCCGVYSLKPTGGRVSARGHISSLTPLSFPSDLASLRSFPAIGPLARSLEDLELAMSILSDFSPDYGGGSELNIAWTDEMPGVPISEEVKSVIQGFVHRLKEAGFRTERLPSANIDFSEALEISGICLGAMDTLLQPALIRVLRKATRLLPSALVPHPLLKGLLQGASLFPETMQAALQRRNQIAERLDDFFETWNVWICPVFGIPAFTHRLPQSPVEIEGRKVSQMLASVSPCVVFNMTGHPAVTIPIGFSQNGLPIGIQIIGRRMADARLLSDAKCIAKHTYGFLEPSDSRESGLWQNPTEFK